MILNLTSEAQILFDKAKPYQREFIRGFVRWLAVNNLNAAFNKADRAKRSVLIKRYSVERISQ